MRFDIVGVMNKDIHSQDTSKSHYYTIRISGNLDAHWSDWFDGMTVTNVGEPNAETIIAGIIPDQAALHGLLNKIRDLGLTVVSVNRSED